MQSGETEPSKSCMKQILETTCSQFLIVFFVTDHHLLLTDIQIAILNLQNWCPEWCIPVNSMNITYRVFCDKKNKAPCGQIPVTIDCNCLKKVFKASTRNHNR